MGTLPSVVSIDNEVRNVIMDLGINMRECTYYLEDSMFWNKISVTYAPFYLI